MILLKIVATAIVCAIAFSAILKKSYKTTYQKWLEEENEKRREEEARNDYYKKGLN